MKKPHGSQSKSEKLAFEAGQQELSNGNDGSCRCPSLGYEPATSSDAEIRINKAFDILFQEVMGVRKSKKTT